MFSAVEKNVRRIKVTRERKNDDPRRGSEGGGVGGREERV